MMSNDMDSLEDRVIFLRHQVKELRKELDELRKVMNALAHAVALMQDKKTPMWVNEYYRKWEKKQKDWFNV